MYFINIGFLMEGVRSEMYAHNKAVSYNKMNALMGEHPDIVIDYSKVLVAQGRLRVAASGRRSEW
ncbi:MAG TPA: DUF6266 family protein [Pedobacter sp.]|nr:DUF6266 family protein [Pedobacter sp.]